ncbi:tetrapyrrole biosynthesis, uroporphyrinogen III synthase [Cercophora newfieldiana]|uniref:Tetrapyrrole biosynthesis, uroporphyrinogen III synthase n=1 Tax=Cercophora newfieldiana TaxID=92897 RepID=A0AA39YC24_9PEZI|nr:tetrapyrrole biosynthesis, uroporphyrinogen III synthase [Cercophora newfieldiana]
MSPKTPVFLLKTKSTPGDAYEELFSRTDDGFNFEPVFVPVLEHSFDETGMTKVRGVLRSNSVSNAQGSPYGGMIFTSQRAVEAFSSLVQEGANGSEPWPDLSGIPIYSVGPATTRALKAVPVPSQYPLNIFGEHTGYGQELAQFILKHYAEWYKDRPMMPPLLFLVGEQRRDVIPRVLGAASFPVDEVVVYRTGVMQSFRKDFDQWLEETADRPERWAVVFSPTGCEAMLSALGVLDGQKLRDSERKTFIATIGTTTRDHLIREFAFHPEVCAAQPSPEGVWHGITQFTKRLVKQ